MQQDEPQIPAHIAVIMDGNGRWAKQRGQARYRGHAAGVKAARGLVEEAGRRGVRCLTLFAFSSENWRRPRAEVNQLMSLFIRALDEQLDELRANGVRLRFIGQAERFKPQLRERMRAAEAATADRDKLTLVVALGYGGRADIVAAARRLAADVAAERLATEGIDEAAFAQRLALHGLPAPDLMIRTGGEHRISNFLLWDLAYSELYFTDVLWPDFDARELDAALAWYAGRERRFGMTPEQAGSRGNDA